MKYAQLITFSNNKSKIFFTDKRKITLTYLMDNGICIDIHSIVNIVNLGKITEEEKERYESEYNSDPHKVVYKNKNCVRYKGVLYELVACSDNVCNYCHLKSFKDKKASSGNSICKESLDSIGTNCTNKQFKKVSND